MDAEICAACNVLNETVELTPIPLCYCCFAIINENEDQGVSTCLSQVSQETLLS
jgi:hypothetical protein